MRFLLDIVLYKSASAIRHIPLSEQTQILYENISIFRFKRKAMRFTQPFHLTCRHYQTTEVCTARIALNTLFMPCG